MLIVPTSLTSDIDGRKLYLVVVGLAINPMLFFSVGALWLISWVHNVKKEIKFTNITIFVLMIVTALFCLEFNDMRTMILLEIVFLSLLVYINGINKITIFSLLSVSAIGIFFILMASHRIQRIKSWFELSSDFMTTLPIEQALDENILLSLIDNLGTFSFIVVIALFLLIGYLILTQNYKKESYKIFAVGVVTLFLIDLALNMLYTFGYSPIYPPTLYLFGYGSSTIIASSIMMGMILMLMKKEKEQS